MAHTPRLLGVDYGDARTGVAVSDAIGFITGEAWVIEERAAASLAARVADAARERGVVSVALGYPLNMDGTPGRRAGKTEALAERLRERGLDVVLWDERRTTADAHRILSEAGARGRKRKKTVDAVAASLILEGYLAYLRNGGGK
ncbi:MAG: Holliday junction resolvase RuvX [Oscillospiraceae bacterium]|jgi:putative Holliday junction resolvase|nr:Holliday junction resolvase RuvX [Oscillospiraceae bacterium]